MLTIQNFKEGLTSVGFKIPFNGWCIEDILIQAEYYTIILKKQNLAKYTEVKYMEVRLYRKADDEMSENSNDYTYKLQFRIDGIAVYDHWVSKNWLMKPPLNLMVRVGDIIEQFVAVHPNYHFLPF